MAKASVSPPKRSDDRSSASNRRKIKVAAVAICAVLLIGFYLLAWSASLNESPTADEPLHFVGAWTQVHQDDFRVNPEDPPLWKYWAAAGTQSEDLKIARQSPMWNNMLHNEDRFQFSQLALYQPGANVNELMSAARARMTFVGVILGAVIAWWAWRLAGPIAAVIATAVLCFDPNFLAHTPLVKNDVAMTLGFMLFMMAVWFVGEKVTVWRWIALALALGAAQTIKFSGVLAFPMLAVAMLVRVLMSQPWPVVGKTVQTRFGRLGVAAVLCVSCSPTAYVMIWACYGFRFSPGSDPTQLFDQKTSMEQIARFESVKAHGAPAEINNEELTRWVAEQPRGLVDKLYQWSDDNHLLPQAWLRGFYYTWGRGLIRACYLLGEVSRTGWWYYFPLAVVFKTPIATLAAIVVAIIFGCAWGEKTNLWAVCVAVVCPVLYAAAAILENLNLGLRHLLPVYPFVFIFLGVVAAEAWKRKPKPTAVIAGVFLLGLMCETVIAYPNYISFFNVASGGSRGGLFLLGDSNLDWGQDLPALAEWQKHNPDKQLLLRYFGPGNPRYYGIQYAYVNGDGVISHLKQNNPPLPLVLAISATDIQGIYLTPEQRARFETFMHRKPIGVLGGTIYLFDHLDDWLATLPKSNPSTHQTTPAM